MAKSLKPAKKILITAILIILAVTTIGVIYFLKTKNFNFDFRNGAAKSNTYTGNLVKGNNSACIRVTNGAPYGLLGSGAQVQQPVKKAPVSSGGTAKITTSGGSSECISLMATAATAEQYVGKRVIVEGYIQGPVLYASKISLASNVEPCVGTNCKKTTKPTPTPACLVKDATCSQTPTGFQVATPCCSGLSCKSYTYNYCPPQVAIGSPKCFPKTGYKCQ